jgi:hypothetical protein
MKSLVKWVVAPAALMAALAFAAPSSAKADWGYVYHPGHFHVHFGYYGSHLHFHPGHVHVIRPYPVYGFYGAPRLHIRSYGYPIGLGYRSSFCW